MRPLLFWRGDTADIASDVVIDEDIEPEVQTTEPLSQPVDSEGSNRRTLSPIT